MVRPEVHKKVKDELDELKKKMKLMNETNEF